MARAAGQRKAAEDVAQLMSARDVLLSPTPDISELVQPWPEKGHESLRFRVQRELYLRHLSQKMQALDVIEDYFDGKFGSRSRRRVQALVATKRHRAAVLARDGHVCGICGGEIEPSDVSIDHITPVSLGGSDDLDNLQPAHKSCNSRKGNRLSYSPITDNTEHC